MLLGLLTHLLLQKKKKTHLFLECSREMLGGDVVTTNKVNYENATFPTFWLATMYTRAGIYLPQATYDG